MTRHARNCTAGAVYTYNEKKKDAQQSGYGTDNQRLGKDSVKDFDSCSLTLQPCRNPVVTKDGYLFDKEAILTYMVTKKNEYSRQLKEYERQKRQEETELSELAAAEKRSQQAKFLRSEKNIVSSTATTSSSKAGESSISNMAGGRDRQLPSFWIPSMTPQAAGAKLSKPSKTISCPVGGGPIRARDLIPVKFTLVTDPDDKKSLITKSARYMCCVTHDILGNTVPAAVIRTTGDVVTMECVEKLIKKDWLHPLTGDTLKPEDIIPLQMGGTGYSTTNEQLEGKNARPVLQA